ncbi:sulfite exporter TauE/SafE family protein [Citreimonas salinaria]|uniref:sulfite exporter TauE/SafE family protein n=1 Tax=Citreimonas salinaria TaxID=321339 RepID=UPI001C431E9A|nr:sulfite exporter TauE/SafE family protein [Citreimonas salinaria]
MASIVFLAAGTVKGIVGIGLPAMAVGVMSQFVDARTSIALVMFPMITSNAWQVFRGGRIALTMKTYKWFVVVLAVGVWPVTAFAAAVNESIMQGALGIIILVFVVVNGLSLVPPLPMRHDTLCQIAAAATAAVFGGLSAVWAPPILIYLASRGIDKDEFMRASGLLILVGSIPLCVGYAQQGLLTGSLSLASALMIVPSIVGFTVGELLRRRVSPEGFRIVLLTVFAALGLNLLRRTFF